MTEILDGIAYGFSVSLSPGNLIACFIGVLMGTIVGVLPGIGPIVTMSLLLPIVMRIDPTTGIIAMAGVFYGAMYGGSTTSILLNLPGEAASVVTCLDGHEMAKRGRAGPALAISAIGSFVAGTLGVVLLTFLAPPFATMALAVGPPELTAILVLSFVLVMQFSGGSRVRAAASAFLGFFLASIGLDPVEASPRFTFNTFTLLDGIGFGPLVIGLFGVAEMLVNLETRWRLVAALPRIHGLWPTGDDLRTAAPAIARGGLIGFFLGILPGMGASIPTFVSYSVEQRLSKRPERFGQGAIEGVAAPESANNAATAGNLVPLLTLGIAPSAATAILMAGFLTHGVTPGPLLIQQHPEIFWGVVTSMYTGNAILLLLNLPLVAVWVRLLMVPQVYLVPPVLLVCAVGTYSVATNPWDVVVMAAFGLLGYVMRKLDFPPVPLVLAFVLGRIFEEALRQSLAMSLGSFTIFLTRPIALSMLLATLAVLVLPLFSTRGRWPR